MTSCFIFDIAKSSRSQAGGDSDIKYLLTTTYSYFDENVDLDRTGGFRVINLQRPPFCLPKPLIRIDDFVVPAIPRYLALWSREQIAKALAEVTSDPD